MTGYFISVFLHILAAMIWIGGLVFFVIVFVPMLRHDELKNVAPKLVQWAGLRFRFWGWVCLITLVATGLHNLFARGYRWNDLFSSDLYQGHFGRMLSIKLAFVALVFVLSAIHDFWLGPKAAALWRNDPNDPRVAPLRRSSRWFGRMNLIFSLVILCLAIQLVRGSPW